MTIHFADPAAAPARCEPILRSVPEWFGIESATRMYIDHTATMPTWIGSLDGADAGFVTIARPQPLAADIYCIAVHKRFHGRGVGTALVAHAEAHLRGLGVRFLQVKTMGPSKPNAEYAMTLRFYERVGFTRLEELEGVWPGIPCLILIKSLAQGGS